MTRQTQIHAGALWQVYPDNNPDNILFEGNKTHCLKFIQEKYNYQYKRGEIRLGKLIWEPTPKIS